MASPLTGGWRACRGLDLAVPQLFSPTRAARQAVRRGNRKKVQKVELCQLAGKVPLKYPFIYLRLVLIVACLGQENFDDATRDDKK